MSVDDGGGGRSVVMEIIAYQKIMLVKNKHKYNKQLESYRSLCWFGLERKYISTNVIDCKH